MNLSYFVDRLSKNRGAFEALVRGISVEQARWKPAPDKWSILEVVNHLFDEEKEDFRQRLQLVLADPAQAWPPIDPPGWVIARRYAERDIEASLDSFLAERQKSLDWLTGLSEPNWNNSKDGSNGIRSAGDLLASWLAHDFLHLRQLSRLHWQFVGAISEPFQTTYAGPWKES